MPCRLPCRRSLSTSGIVYVFFYYVLRCFSTFLTAYAVVLHMFRNMYSVFPHFYHLVRSCLHSSAACSSSFGLWVETCVLRWVHRHAPCAVWVRAWASCVGCWWVLSCSLQLPSNKRSFWGETKTSLRSFFSPERGRINLVDLEKCFPMSIYLRKSASIQKRMSLSKLGG